LLCPRLPDANGIRIASGAEHTSSNNDIIAAGGKIETGSIAQRNVEATSSIVEECIDAAGRVAIAVCIAVECAETSGGIVVAGLIAVEGSDAAGRVLGAGGVEVERLITAGCIVVSSIMTQRITTSRRVV